MVYMRKLLIKTTLLWFIGSIQDNSVTVCKITLTRLNGFLCYVSVCYNVYTVSKCQVYLESEAGVCGLQLSEEGGGEDLGQEL